jgi:hypothetical protein
MNEAKPQKKWTTMSVDYAVKRKLDEAIIKKRKKMTYNSVLIELLDEFLKSDENQNG